MLTMKRAFPTLKGLRCCGIPRLAWFMRASIDSLSGVSPFSNGIDSIEIEISRFLLPTNCAGSFVGNSGFIQYYCKANIVRPWYKADEKTKEVTLRKHEQKLSKLQRFKSFEVFTVSTPLDLNCIPHASLPLQISESKDFSFMFIKRGNIQMTVSQNLVKSPRHNYRNLQVKMNRRSVVPGETLVVETDISNGTSKTIKKVWWLIRLKRQFHYSQIEVKLAQSCHYIAYRRNGVSIFKFKFKFKFIIISASYTITGAIGYDAWRCWSR